MGWLYMTSLAGHAGPRQYLDAQFTYENSGVTSRVLRSALVGMHVYYAAIEHVRAGTSEREVWAAVCLVRYNPRDRDGYIFGYKDMEESMGPVESDCPEPILDLLTPTDKENALQWRTRCRDSAAARRVRRAKPMPRPGQVIVFEEPLTFIDGKRFDRLDVVANPRSHRTVLFRARSVPREGPDTRERPREARQLTNAAHDIQESEPACHFLSTPTRAKGFMPQR